MNIDANVQKIIFALIRRWKLLVIFAIIGGLLGYFYTAQFTEVTYTSTVKFLTYAVDSQQELSDSAMSATSGNDSRVSNTSKMNYAMKMLNTYIEIFKTNEFNGKIASSLNERINAVYSDGTIKNAIKYEIVEETAMFTATVTTADQKLSLDIAQQLELTIPEEMQNRNSGLVHASVEDHARAGSAGSLGYPQKMAIGAVIGIVIAAAYVILRNLLDVRIRTDEELIDKYNIPVLGSIPNFQLKGVQAQQAKVVKSKKGADVLDG